MKFENITTEQLGRLTDAIKYYLWYEFGDEVSKEELVERIKTGHISLANTTEKDYYEVQVDYSFDNECLEYYVDCELVKTQKLSIDGFIEYISSASFGDIVAPGTGYVCGMYEPLEERAMEILGVASVEVFPGWGEQKEYLVVAFSYRDNWRRKYYVDNIEELTTAIKGKG